jgi:putative peptide zinc metalloprotease protein
MTTMADSLVNSAMRPLKLRRRPDLESRKHHYDGRSYWVVKEPLGLNYFRFHEEEFAILNMLDGQTSLQAIKDRFQAEFAPQRISLQDLQQFVGMLHKSGLVISHAVGQGKPLRRRGETKKRKEWISKLSNVFAIRFRGIDPERILNALLPWFGWLFTTWCLFLSMFLGLAAITLVLVNYQEFRGKLPTFETFFAANNWLWLGLTMGAVKVLHEFGHGLSCKKFGGECHEMGLMFLVFTPCLYCNVSDSWMLPNKWQRVFIGAAGMYVELIIASIATFLWWYSEDGMFHFLCLSVMFICSVSTVVFNGNPLLRFDGYYILMDTLEIPNLRQKASEILKRWFQKNCLGLELQENPFLPQGNRLLFGAYTIGSFVYRWVVAFGIIMFLNQVLKPYGLQSLGRAFAVAGLAGMVVPGVMSVVKFLRQPGRAAKMKRANITTSLIVASAILSVIAFLPVPFYVYCPTEIQPTRSFEVRTIVAGQLVTWHKKPQDSVLKGEVLCELQNMELKYQRVKAEGELQSATIKLQDLQRSSAADSQQIQYLRIQQEDVQSKQNLLAVLDQKIANLVIRSPMDGFVFKAPPKEESKAAKAQEQLPSWHGDPFDPANSEVYFSEGDLLCLVGPEKKMEGIMIVDQHDRDLLQAGDRVSLMLESARLESLKGTIVGFSASEIKEAPPQLSIQVGGSLDTKSDESGRTIPISTSYQARVEFDSAEIPSRPGYRGESKVHLTWRSLGWRLKRYFMKTFNFEF